MKVYLASRYSRREEMLSYAAQLRDLGVAVTSRWIDGGHQITDAELNDGLAQQRLGDRYATEDIVDLGHADLLICFTEEPRTVSSRGGRHVEFGIAIATNKETWIVGPCENAFHCLHSVRRYELWTDAKRGIEDRLINLKEEVRDEA